MAGPRDLMLRLLIGARDDASPVLERIGGGLKRLGAAVAAYFTGRAIGQFFGDAISGAADLELQISKLQAVSGASAAEMAALNAEAERLGASDSIDVTAAEAAAAMTTLAQAGQSTREVLASITPVLALAQGAQIDFATAAGYVTATLSGFRLPAEDAARVADVLSVAAQSANTTVQGLAGALSYAAPVATSLGQSLEETVAQIALMQDAGIAGERAGTALVNILSQIADPASRAQQELRAVGISARTLDEVLAGLQRAGAGGESAMLAFGMEAGPALRALLGQGAAAVDDLTSRLLGSAGAADEAARQMADNLRGSLKALGSVWDAARQSLVTPLLGPLRDQVDALADAIARFAASPAMESIRAGLVAAFTAAAEAVSRFAGQVDWSALGARIADSVSRIGEALRRFGEDAARVGGAVRQVWAGIEAGANAVLTVFRGVQQAVELVVAAITGTLSLMLRGIASAMEGLAKMGVVSELTAAKWRIAHEEMREATGELVESSKRHYQDMLDSAERTGESLTRMADGTGAAAAEAREESAALAAAREQMRLAAEEASGLTAQERMLAEQTREFEAAADGAAGAAGRLASATGEAGAAASAVEDAYRTLGITSQATLAEQAERARIAYETIRNSGVAAPQDIAEAFRASMAAAAKAGDDAARSMQSSMARMREGAGYERADAAAGQIAEAQRPIMDTTARIIALADAMQAFRSGQISRDDLAATQRAIDDANPARRPRPRTVQAPPVSRDGTPGPRRTAGTGSDLPPGATGADGQTIPLRVELDQASMAAVQAQMAQIAAPIVVPVSAHVVGGPTPAPTPTRTAGTGSSVPAGASRPDGTPIDVERLASQAGRQR